MAEATIAKDGSVVIAYQTTDERESAKMQTLMWELKAEFTFSRKLRTGVTGDGWVYSYVFTLPEARVADVS